MHKLSLKVTCSVAAQRNKLAPDQNKYATNGSTTNEQALMANPAKLPISSGKTPISWDINSYI